MDLKGSEEGSAAVQRQSVDSKGAEKWPVEGPVRENGDEIHVHIEEHTINQKVKFEPTHEKTNNVISEELQTTRPKDNSPQDNSPHIKLAPRQLAPLSEDNSPHFRRQLAPL